MALRIRVPQVYPSAITPSAITGTFSEIEADDVFAATGTVAAPVIPPPPPPQVLYNPEEWLRRQPVYATALYPTGSQK